MSTINIIIPAYNEEKRLPATLQSLSEYINGSKHDIRTYVVNDGSKDQTRLVAHNHFQTLDIPGDVLDYGINRGKGFAVKYGMLNTRKADYYYLADADLSSGWETLDKLLKVLETEPSYAAAIGSRAMADSEVQHVQSRHISGRVSNFLIDLFLDLGFKDTQCGYKLFRENCLHAFNLLTIDRWGFDFELLYLLRKLDLKVKEVGIKWHNVEGSKVKFTDYFKTLEQLWRVRRTHYPI